MIRLLLLLPALAVLAPPPVVAQAPEREAYTLRRAIETALANSHDLDAAEAALDVARQQVREAWSSVLPDVRFNASYTRNLRVPAAFLPAIIFDPSANPDDVIPVRFGSDNQWQAQVNLSQPLFEAQAFIGVGAAGRFREVEEERVRGTAQGVVSAVRQAYFGALLAQEDHRRITESVRRISATLDETRAMNRAGLTSDYDVLRFEVQLAGIQAQVRRAENAVEAARRQILVELGLDPATPIGLVGSLFEIDLENLAANNAANAELLTLSGMAEADANDAERLIRTAMESRTELRQLRGAIDLDEARLSVERAQLYPTLSVFSNWAMQAQENGPPSFFGESGNQRATSALAGLRVELPIFTGFSRFARISQAKATVRQGEARLVRAERETASQVTTLYENTREARQRAASQRAAIGQAQRGFEIATAEYRAGVGSQLQVTDAEAALRTAEFNYAQAVYDYLTARALLDLAVGTAPAALADVQWPTGQE